MAKFKVMVVGTGKRGKHHVAAFKANPDFEVVGLCDINMDMLNAAAESLGLQNVVKGTDAAKMADELKPDVFCVWKRPVKQLVKPPVQPLHRRNTHKP